MFFLSLLNKIYVIIIKGYAMSCFDLYKLCTVDGNIFYEGMLNNMQFAKDILHKCYF